MNLLKVTVAVVCSICLATPCSAENNQQASQNPKSTTTLVKTNRGASIRRPKSPDRQQVTCTYDGEVMNINFTISEGMAMLSVTDDSLQFLTFEIDTTPLDVYITIGAHTGTINIELETENGNIFSGTIE